ncbi:MAG: DUF4177 domain-containing protein [Methanolinea sp.]|nr:DUF4177 domain-containing protein [Methanolinea sp.]
MLSGAIPVYGSDLESSFTGMKMANYEYKTVILELEGMGWLSSKEIPNLVPTLNREGKNGWRLKDTILPSGTTGECDKIILIFEREVNTR